MNKISLKLNVINQIIDVYHKLLYWYRKIVLKSFAKYICSNKLILINIKRLVIINK